MVVLKAMMVQVVDIGVTIMMVVIGSTGVGEVNLC